MMFKRKKGITLIEALMAVALLGVVSFFIKIGLGVVINLMKERVELEVQRDSQVTLYLMTKDIRSAESILSLNGLKTPTTFCGTTASCVALKTYDASHGYDIRVLGNEHFLDETNVSTVTYVYVAAQGATPAFLRRVVEWNGAIKEDREFLKGLIRLNPNTATPLFQTFPAGDVYPYSGVTVDLYLMPDLLRDNPVEFNSNITLRSQT